MSNKGIGIVCWYCETENDVSASELYGILKEARRVGMTCLNCGRLSVVNVSDLPSTKNIESSEWSPKIVERLGENWLPCMEWKDAAARLPLGYQALPGDLLAPQRLWLYKNAVLEQTKEKSDYWTWEEYVRHFGFDPYIKIRLMRGPNWEKSIFGDQIPHVRSRLISLKAV